MKFYNREEDVTDNGETWSEVGWLEANVVQTMDPNHVWFDPTVQTFRLFMRANTSGAGYAALAKVTECPDGTMKTSLERAPSGVRTLSVPFPGGQMRFHLLWDEKTSCGTRRQGSIGASQRR